ncbi:MAG TPA: cupin domain-containing protein [Bacillota bacterium]|nr:cupin domain-containing protein [Bacillota bacterium]
MKIVRINTLGEMSNGHFLQKLLPGTVIYKGGFSLGLPGKRTHSFDGPEGSDWHVHDDYELFIVLQGCGELEVNQKRCPVRCGDVIIIEPGEDHHLISDMQEPLIVSYCHARSQL